MNGIKRKTKTFLTQSGPSFTTDFQIGKNGINDAVIVQINEALEKRELIKINLLQNTDEIAEDVAHVLEEKINCEIVQIIGRVLVLYKASSKEKYQKISKEVQGI